MDHPYIGPVTLNHPAFLVMKGEMESALSFFSKVFGWITDDERVISGDWGQARFLFPNISSMVCVQLTEHKNMPARPTTFSGTHLGVNVDNAEEAAKAIEAWAKEVGKSCIIEPANPAGDKWFIKLNTLFTFKIELVSRPDCRTCKGEGHVKGPGTEATASRECGICGGSGKNRKDLK